LRLGLGVRTCRAMPQTPPFHGLSLPRKLTDTELARALRLDLESELDAINLYAAHLEATDNATARAVLRHVMDEEREHAALFWALIGQLDPSQAGHAREAMQKLELLASGASDEEVEAAGGARSAVEIPPLGGRGLEVA
jgi:rubrerythrin